MKTINTRSSYKASFCLRVSAGPIAWAKGASPKSQIGHRNVTIVEREGDIVLIRRLRSGSCNALLVESTPPGPDHEDWLRRTFREHDAPIAWEDPVLARLATQYPGLASYTDGSLFTGIVTSIIGQSISIASAMAAQRRLAASFHPGIWVDDALLHPLPDDRQLADASVDLIRASGVTWKRAEAIHTIARESVAGNLPDPASIDDGELERDLRHLPMVGPWTAASALLWGIGAPDAYPSGDVALLRAARLAYAEDGMTMRDLHAIAEGWRPYRAIATRLLWTGLLGPGW